MSDSGLPSSVDDPEGGKKASYERGGQAFIPDNTMGNYNVTSNAEATAAVSEREDIQISSPVQESNPLNHGAQGGTSSWQGDYGQAEGRHGEACGDNPTLGQRSPIEGVLEIRSQREGSLGHEPPREGAQGQALPRKLTQGQVPPREGTQGQVLPRELTQQQGLPREGTLGQGLPREGTLGQGLPRKETLGQVFPREGTLEQGLSTEGTLGQGFSREGTLGQGLSREGTLGEVFPREGTLGQGLSTEGTLGQGLSRVGTIGQGPQIQENSLRLLNQDMTQTGQNEGERDADTLISHMLDLNVEELGPLSINESRSGRSVTQTQSSTRDISDHGAENQGTERKQLEATSQHGDQVLVQSTEASYHTHTLEPISQMPHIDPNLQHGYSNSEARLSCSSLPGAMPSTIPADELRIPERQISVPVPYTRGPPPGIGAGPLMSGSSVPHYQQGLPELRQPREPYQHQYQFPGSQPLPINPSFRQPLNQPLYHVPNIPPTPYQPERSYAAHFQPIAYQPSPRAGPPPPPPPPQPTMPMVRDGRGTPEGWSELEIAREGRGQPYQASADSCTTCIGFLLDNTGQSEEMTRKKRSILFKLLPSSSQFSAKTIIGLAERLLQLSPEELQYMIEHPTLTVHLRTCVHIAIRDMGSEGKKLGHLVEYFMADYSKRVDIVKLVLELHRSCAFCQTHYNRLP